MYLGVDGGGTKTAFTLISESGEVLAEHAEPGAYYLDIGIEALAGLIETGVRAVLAKIGKMPEDVKFAFFGLPAYGEDSSFQSALDQVPSGVFPKGNYLCGNDMVCAWAGSLGCQDGINLIAGTGSIAYGRFRGREARCGGWGEAFSDEGSAYWIGIKGLQIFSKMSDGRLHRGPLYELIREEYALAQDLDLSTMVLGAWGSDRAKIATVSRLVANAAREGDLDATQVFLDAADELVAIVESTCRQLAFPADHVVPVSFSGGVFNAGNLMLQPFSSGLANSPVHYNICEPKMEPSVGAAHYAGLLDDCDAIARKVQAFSQL